MKRLVVVSGNMIIDKRDALAFVGSSVLMVATVEGVNWLGRRSVLSPRKTLHVLAGPVFMLTWPWFSPNGRWWAALLPLGMTLKFALVGLGVLRSEKDVRTMSRTGNNRSEILRGPLFYGFSLVALTALAFRELKAAAAIMALCFGDAAAEVCGERFGRRKLPWSPRKSYAGSAGFVAATGIAMGAVAVLFRRWGFVGETIPRGRLALSAVVGAMVESLPFPEIDNILVPFAVAAVFLPSLETRFIF